MLLSAYVDVKEHELAKYLPTCITVSKFNDRPCPKKKRQARAVSPQGTGSCYSTRRFRINCRPISDQIIRLGSLQALKRQTVSVLSFTHRRLKIQKVCEEFPRISDIPVAGKRKKGRSKKIRSAPKYNIPW